MIFIRRKFGIDPLGNVILTYFRPMFSSYNPWKVQKTFSGVAEMTVGQLQSNNFVHDGNL